MIFDMIEPLRKKLTKEAIASFLEGNDPMEHIVNMEYGYRDNFVTIYYRNDNYERCKTTDWFYPFLWSTRNGCEKLCGGDRSKVKDLLNKYGIKVRALDVTYDDGKVCDELLDGYIFMFQARRPMTNSDFHKFFKEAGNPIYMETKSEDGIRDKNPDYMSVPPLEQYMIYTGRRFFKGYGDYDDILRMTFDIETTGLDMQKEHIEQIGIRFNHPVVMDGKKVEFERIFNTKTDDPKKIPEMELRGIDNMLRVIYSFDPDIITAHNGESFDIPFLMTTFEKYGLSLTEHSKGYFGGEGLRKDNFQTTLKLGGEVERFSRTLIPGRIVTDSLHAVRRAQAIDSNMLKANLKYVSQYSKIAKPNRVYLPGDQISTVWNDNTESYAHNDKTGDWYKVTEEKPIKEGYDMRTGRYIAERYLLDDLYECDKVELRYNQPNFLICKMIPVPFSKCCTMGTAGQWKSLMLAWSYENNLAIPLLGPRKSFTGGLSRLLTVGYIPNVAKFDYNSLYPSIILTWAISNKKDITKVMLFFLEHILTHREKFKGLMKKAGKEADRLEDLLKNLSEGDSDYEDLLSQFRKAAYEQSSNDKKQLPMKIFGNSYFGSFGAPQVFNWASVDCAEQTTCTGRMSLRLMIYHFNKLGYKPIVGDSFTGDTPLFVKYDNDGSIDILPISELMNTSSISKDVLGREYDYSKKPYKVLCRSGWKKPEYIYRHGTEKEIYNVSDSETGACIDVTEDHSLFNSDREKITPSAIRETDRLEYYKGPVLPEKTVRAANPVMSAKLVLSGAVDRVPKDILNATEDDMRTFISVVKAEGSELLAKNKVLMAGMRYVNERSIGR